MKQFIPIIILINISISSFAGDTLIYNQTVSLDTVFSHYDNVEVIGHKSITLDGGFTFSSNGNGSFTANADPWNIEEPSGFLPPGTSIDSSGILNGSYIVGTINGQSGVSSLGAATYSIPIQVPAGNNGMVPQLSVNYNSQSGDRILGRGWNLSGISAIIATGRNFYYDSIRAPISATDSECRLVWDGQRLFGTNGTGFAATSFKTEIFSNSQITKSGSGQTAYFTIKTPGGITLEYGKSSNSRMHLTSTIEWMWLLEKAYDRYGNTIKYTYTPDTNKKQILLSKIEYGGLSTELVNEINLHYSTRMDLQYTYILDNLTVNDQILDSISIMTNDVFVGGYGFKYDTLSGESLFDEIFQYDKDSHTYNSTKIDWDVPAFDIDATPTYQNIEEGSNYYTGDFNGDGYSDLISVYFNPYVDECKSYLYNGSSNGLGSYPDDTIYLPRSYTHDLWDEIQDLRDYNCDPLYPIDSVDFYVNKEDILGIFTGDYDGDGIDELFIKYSEWDVLGKYLPDELTTENVSDSISNSGLENEICDYDTMFYSTHLMEFDEYFGRIINLDLDSSSSDFSSAFHADKLFPTTEQYSQYPDIGGYGYSTYHDDGHLYYYDTENDTSIAFCNLKKTPRWGEFSGDGMPDFIEVETDSFKIRSYDVSYNGFVLEDTVFGTYLGNIDLNGDGSDGYVYIPSDTSELVIDFLDGMGQKTSLGNIDPDEFTRAMSMDINSDGLNELLLFDDDILKRIYYDFIPSLENNEVSYSYSIKNCDYNLDFDYYTEIGDYNGDGILELICPNNNAYLWFITNGISQKQVSGITNGLGIETKYYYKTLTDSDVYVKGSNASFPVSDFIAPLNIVSEFVLDNGIANPDSIRYKYESAKVHRQGKGLLGYMKTTSENLLHNTKSVSNYSYDDTFFKGYPVSSTQSINSNTVKSSSYSSSITQVDGKRFKILTDTVVNTDHLNNVTSTTSFKYNSYAQPTEKKLETGSESVTETYSYTSSGWIFPYLPYTINKEYIRGSTESDSTVLTYNTNGSLAARKAFAGTNREHTTRYSNYNSFGSPKTITAIAKRGENLAIDSVSVNLTYSSCGRFVASKKGELNTKAYFDYDLTTGVLNKKTSVNDHEVSYSYGPFLRREKETSPDLVESVSKVYWTGDHEDAPTGSLYLNWSMTSSSSPIMTFYDEVGRELRTVTVSFNGETIYSDTKYDSQGRVIKKSLPYEKTDSPLWDSTNYDNYGRVNEQIAPDSTKTSYTYNALWVKATISKGSISQSSEKTLNAWGEIVQNKDNLGNIVYRSYYPDGKLKESYTSVNPSEKTSFQYDAMGKRISISDPDADTVTSSYDGFGMLLSQTDAKGDTTSFTYDKLGRAIKSTDDRGDINYVYVTDTTDAAFGQIDSIYNTGASLSESFTYDDYYGRLLSSTKRIPDKTFTNSFTYDWFGRPLTRTYPSGYEVEYSYTEVGYLEEITGAGTTIWSCNDISALGQITSYSQGSYTTDVDYDAYGILEEVTTGSVFNMEYGFDDMGNLSWREDVLTTQKEEFTYDNLNRITGIDYYFDGSHISAGDLDLSYDNGGNITSKSDIGTTINYGEGTAGPHALTSIEDLYSAYEPPPQVITYTDFNKVSIIQDTIGQDSTLTLTFTYGLNNQRVKTVLSRNSIVERIKYFNGDYEEDSTSTGTKKYHYINSPTGLVGIFVKEGSADTLYHVLTDHLGSLSGIINEETDSVTYYSYNAWGVPRDPDDWKSDFDGELFAGRGYTGHEHLMEFSLINMNGRVYDPVLGRFLSPDPIVQFPGYANSHNRYAYVMNNPLKYVDPSGYTQRLNHRKIYNEEYQKLIGEGHIYPDEQYEGVNHMMFTNPIGWSFYQQDRNHGVGVYFDEGTGNFYTWESQPWHSLDFAAMAMDAGGNQYVIWRKYSGVKAFKVFQDYEIGQASKGGRFQSWWNTHWTSKIIPDVVYFNFSLGFNPYKGPGSAVDGYAIQLRGKKPGLYRYSVYYKQIGFRTGIALNVGYSTYIGDTRNFDFAQTMDQNSSGWESDILFIGVNSSITSPDETGGALYTYEFGGGPGFGFSYSVPANVSVSPILTW